MKFFSSPVFWYVIIAVIIVIFAVLVIKNYVKKLSQGCCGAGSDEKIQRVKVIDRDKSHYPYKTVLVVDGMVCGNCAQRVENALNVLDGTWANADVSAGKVTVLTKKQADEKTLRDAVNNIGAYTVMKVE